MAGEAKRRGPYETRKTLAIERDNIEHKKWLKAKAVRDFLKTPGQKKKERKFHEFMACTAGIIGATNNMRRK